MPHLTILGASARAAAFSAARGGFAPHAVDCFADTDVAGLCPAVRIDRYPHGFLAALSAAPTGPWIYTGGLENHPRLVERLAKTRALWGNSAEVLRRVRDPWLLAATLGEAGLAFPGIARLATGGDWLVKPLRGSAGLGVRRATARDLRRPPQDAVLQQYVEGEAASAVFVAGGGKAVLLGTTRQLIGRDFGLGREFLYAGSIGPLLLRHEEQSRLERIGAVLAERFSLVGLFGVDFIRGPDELWPVEVNPRYTASVEILERLTGRHFVALHADACEHRRLPECAPPSALKGCFGKTIVYAPHQSRWGNRAVSSFLADIPATGQQFAAGHPVVTAFAAEPTAAGVEAALRRLVHSVQQALEPI